MGIIKLNWDKGLTPVFLCELYASIILATVLYVSESKTIIYIVLVDNIL